MSLVGEIEGFAVVEGTTWNKPCEQHLQCPRKGYKDKIHNH